MAEFKNLDDVLNFVLDRIQKEIDKGLVKTYPDYDYKKVVSDCWDEFIKKTQKVNNAYHHIVSIADVNTTVKAFEKMVNLGLSSVKKQGYFQLESDKFLVFTPSYLGSSYIAKRDLGVKLISSNVVYEDDIFEYEINIDTGYKKILAHKQELKNINNAKILGAYAMAVYNDGTKKAEVMSFSQITLSWAMGGSKGESKAHKNFPDEMAKKTVINRMLKEDLSTSGIILEDSFEEQQDQEIKNNSTSIVEARNVREEKTDDAKLIELQRRQPIVQITSVLHEQDILTIDDPVITVEQQAQSQPAIEEEDPF